MILRLARVVADPPPALQGWSVGEAREVEPERLGLLGEYAGALDRLVGSRWLPFSLGDAPPAQGELRADARSLLVQRQIGGSRSGRAPAAPGERWRSPDEAAPEAAPAQAPRRRRGA